MSTLKWLLTVLVNHHQALDLLHDSLGQLGAPVPHLVALRVSQVSTASSSPSSSFHSPRTPSPYSQRLVSSRLADTRATHKRCKRALTEGSSSG